MKSRFLLLWGALGCLLLLVSGEVWGQGQPVEVSEVRFRGDFEQQEWDNWLSFGDRWLEDDRDYYRFLLGKAEYKNNALTLVVLGYMTGGCWADAEAYLKDDKILLTVKCQGEAGPAEDLEVMEFTLNPIEPKPYKVFIEKLEADPLYRGEREDEFTGKLHRRAKEVRGVTYFNSK